MIHAYAIDPQFAATFGRVARHMFFRDKFGLGCPRVLLELPKFTLWRSQVVISAKANGDGTDDLKRLEKMIVKFEQARVFRPGCKYDKTKEWLLCAEEEYQRTKYAGIIASHNPRDHEGIITWDAIVEEDSRWEKRRAATPPKLPKSFSQELLPFLVNASHIHIVDPHFGPENVRHRRMLESLLGRMMLQRDDYPDLICIHCEEKSKVEFFNQQSRDELAPVLPKGLRVRFLRWKELADEEAAEWLHQRYILSDLGGVIIGGGVDTGKRFGYTDDINLMDKDQFSLRWDQFLGDPPKFVTSERQPEPIVGQR